jgi:hypothetical protein
MIVETIIISNQDAKAPLASGSRSMVSAGKAG